MVLEHVQIEGNVAAIGEEMITEEMIKTFYGKAQIRCDVK